MNVTIVGTGPGSLSAADLIRTHSPGTALTVVEKGRPPRARHCPVDAGKRCRGCSGICNVISGFGGAMHYGDSIKLSKFPAGRRLRHHLGNDCYDSFEREALKFFRLSDSRFTPSTEIQVGAFNIRGYPVAEIGEKALNTFLDYQFAALEHDCRLLMATRLVGLNRASDHPFIVEATHEKEQLSWYSDIVILGMGRSGIGDISKLLKTFDVSTTSPDFSIGVRIEMPAEYLDCLYGMHPDFKFSRHYGDVKIKSFCFSSSGYRGGRIKYCHYQDQLSSPVIFLDGHTHVDHAPQLEHGEGPSGNLALLVQQRVEDPGHWVNHDLVPRYMALFGGRPAYQGLSAFMGTPEEHRVTPSVRDIQLGRIEELFSVEAMRGLRAAASDLLDVISHISGVNRSTLIAESTVMAPELEFFWPQVHVSPAFETEVPGLYVIGDAAGIAQGNLQAAITGIAAAQHILEKIDA